MPDLEDHFQYRNLDVTSIKITAQLWAPDISRSFVKNSNHLARDDIYDSYIRAETLSESFPQN